MLEKEVSKDKFEIIKEITNMKWNPTNLRMPITKSKVALIKMTICEANKLGDVRLWWF